MEISHNIVSFLLDNGNSLELGYDLIISSFENSFTISGKSQASTCTANAGLVGLFVWLSFMAYQPL